MVHSRSNLSLDKMLLQLIAEEDPMLSTKFKTREEAKAKVLEYIMIFYHRKRPHSTYDNMTPEEYLIIKSYWRVLLKSKMRRPTNREDYTSKDCPFYRGHVKITR